MEIIRAYKTELKPNDKQKTLFGRCCGASRYVYNWGVAEWRRQYNTGEKPSAYGLKKQFNAQKDDICPWIRALPYTITESAFINLGAAYKHFFRRLKNKEKEPGRPKFKKRSSPGSFQTKGFRIESNRIRVSGYDRGVEWVRLKEHDYIPTDASYTTYATISEKAGRWFVSVLVKEEIDIDPPDNDSILVLGVDFGIKTLAMCSDGTEYENPKLLRSAQRKLRLLDRELSRRTRGGQNWKKTKLRRQKQHARVANIRKHLLHGISSSLVSKNPKMIVIEDLNVRGMMANHKLAQAVSDVSFYELRRQIEYKSAWHGIEVVVADRWFPSSKLCSACGCICEDLTLSDREYVCDCGNIIDRDLNAAINLAAYGLKP